MKEIIKTIFQEWLDRELPTVIEREIDLENYLHTDHVVVVKGFRRVGKTFQLYGLIKKLLQTHKKKEVIYINFEDERIPLKTEFLSLLLPTLNEITGSTPLYLFLDEVQAIPGWSRWVRRLIDMGKIRIFISGSSSKISEREIPTELRGRYLEVEMSPLSFLEYLKFRSVPLPGAGETVSKNQETGYLNMFREYLYSGGMPAVVLAEVNLKKEILLNYYNTLIRRDIIEKYGIRNEESLKDLVKLIVNTTRYSGTKMFNNLKGIGHSIGKATVLKYIAYLRDSFFMDELFEFSPKQKSQLQREKKIYIIDTGFIDLLTSRTNLKEGRLFENVVFYYLRKQYKNSDIFYYRADKDEEVDFLIIDNENKKMVQAAYNLDRPSTQDREIRALVKAGKKFHIDSADIITFNTETEENISWFGYPLHLRLLPAWKLFLSTLS